MRIGIIPSRFLKRGSFICTADAGFYFGDAIARTKRCIGPAPFRQAQGPERVEGLVAGPMVRGGNGPPTSGDPTSFAWGLLWRLPAPVPWLVDQAMGVVPRICEAETEALRVA